MQCSRLRRNVAKLLGTCIIASFAAIDIAKADEGGVSFWLPGLFGSLAATPQQPGWSLATIYYHTTVSAGGDVARAREFTIGRIPLNLSANLSANLNATGDLALINPAYTFAAPVLGGQATVGLMSIYGRTATSLAGQLTGTLSIPGFVSIPFSRFDSISDSVTGFGDLYPQLFLRWNAGVHNYMIYITGDIPVGAYDSNRLSNIGLGHGAIDTGAGYTYLNPQTGQEFSAVLGFTYNFENKSTQYQNGVDMHLDWGTSQFLTSSLWSAWLATSTRRSVATAGPAIGSAASSRKSSASARRWASSSRSATCRATSISTAVS
jgi:hypothetical protein